MASGADLELKKAFQELHTKKVSTTQQLTMMEHQRMSLQKKITYSKLVASEVLKIPDDVTKYTGVGRMFLCISNDELSQEMTEERKHCEENIANIEKNRAFLEKSLKESEDNLRELVTSKQKHR